MLNNLFTLKIFLFLAITTQIIALSAYDSMGQIEDKFSTGVHHHLGTEIPFQLFIPNSYESSRQYPLLLHLHGAGSRGTDNIIQIDRPAIAYFTSDSNQTKHPAFVLCPQCPKGQQWVDFPWEQGNYIQDSIPESNELIAVEDLLDSIINHYSIDTNRLYAYGESMGGFGTWDLITRNPNKFAATISVVGAGDPSKMHLIKHMAIWGFHGNADRVVPVTGTRNMMKILDSLGSDVLYTNCNLVNCDGMSKVDVEAIISSDSPQRHIYSELDGVGHELWSTYIHEFDGIIDWLFSFSKSSTIPQKDNKKIEVKSKDKPTEW
ncbi:MAG: alpha/beta hydrolase-fold protein [Prolixibacteraceae bacterium]|jgi:predicted peptidase|nr:alpha/beta hydrolase-fold protein [Prolixibacteraceae bacterium]